LRRTSPGQVSGFLIPRLAHSFLRPEFLKRRSLLVKRLVNGLQKRPRLAGHVQPKGVGSELPSMPERTRFDPER